jgi:putative tricarboxylic transport membrane protein
MKKNLASSRSELLLALGLLALGLTILFQTRDIAGAQAYEQLGPRLFPLLIGAGMAVCGAGLAWQGLSGGWRGMPPQETHRRPDWFAFGLIGAALALHMALIGLVGFVLATMLMFLLVARAFGSRRWPRDAAIGATVSILAFYLFTRALGLHLPASPLGVL